MKGLAPHTLQVFEAGVPLKQRKWKWHGIR